MALITDLAQYQPDRESVKKYYANLLILQYRNKPKARETIKIWVDALLGDGLVFQIPDILDIDKAAGETLDIIGKILDCPRIVQGIVIDRKFFQFHEDENSLGYSTVGHPNYASFRSRQNSNLSKYALEDEDYRLLLKFKALVNVLRGSIADIDNALYAVFGDKVLLQNNQDLSIGYVIQTDNMLSVIAAKLLGYFRAPSGVKLDYVIAVPNTPNSLGFTMPVYIP